MGRTPKKLQRIPTMHIDETKKSKETGYELSLSAEQQQAHMNLAIMNRNLPADSCRAKPGYVLSFDNPAHARQMA